MPLQNSVVAPSGRVRLPPPARFLTEGFEKWLWVKTP